MKTPRVPERRTLAAAIGAAVAASICCLGPIVLIGFGASGAWMSRLSLLEPIRPLLILMTGGFLGYSFAKVYAESANLQSCEPGSLCADPRTTTMNKFALWGGTVFVAAMLMAPSLIGVMDSAKNTAVRAGEEDQGLQESGGIRQRVVLSIDNMTCAGCSSTVRGALSALDGVRVLEVTSEPPRAIVEFDRGTVSIATLIEATTEVGYPSAQISNSN
ncbi:MAG TPA: mercury transporter MerT [Nannocystis exedens]|nr:mercury transporter MerT [Nannocystis exedens]